MALERLAAAIRQSPNIIGFRRSLGEDNIALYADDALLFLVNTSYSLVAMMSPISTNGSFSGFTINLDKSVLLLKDPLVNNMPSLASKIAVVSTFKYLGIQVTSQM